ncbi:unnamed protein product [Lathyrus sativus]|nr:unnamed protein product [Lathyrus sativus]
MPLLSCAAPPHFFFLISPSFSISASFSFFLSPLKAMTTTSESQNPTPSNRYPARSIHNSVSHARNLKGSRTTLPWVVIAKDGIWPENSGVKRLFEKIKYQRRFGTMVHQLCQQIADKCSCLECVLSFVSVEGKQREWHLSSC